MFGGEKTGASGKQGRKKNIACLSCRYKNDNNNTMIVFRKRRVQSKRGLIIRSRNCSFNSLRKLNYHRPNAVQFNFRNCPVKFVIYQNYLPGRPNVITNNYLVKILINQLRQIIFYLIEFHSFSFVLNRLH